MSSQTFFSSSPGPSSSGRLRPRRSKERSSSQADLGFGLESSQTIPGEGGTQIYDHDGQDIFKGLILPPLDDPDDLSYEGSDDGARPSKRKKLNADDKENDGIDLPLDQKPSVRKPKGKAKERERSADSRARWRSESTTPAMKDEPRSDYDPDSFFDEEFDDGDYDDDLPLVDEGDRSNKFQGASKTWRNWTKKERVEFDAMEKIRSRDLSAHLFNAFALRKRARELGTAARNGTPGPATSTSGMTGLDGDFSAYPGGEGTNFLFTPPKSWTAWPVPANIVPRVDENRFRDPDDVWTIRMDPDCRPSAELEECVIAEMLRAAKEKFNVRPEKTGGEGMESGRTSRHGSRAPTVVSGMDDEMPGKDYSEVESEVVDVGEYLHIPILKPVVTADDEKARVVLRPAVRQILTTLDELLMGLHNARKAYVTAGGIPKMDPATEGEDSQEESVSIKKRKRFHTTGTDDNASEQEIAQKPAAPSDSGQNQKGARSKSGSRQLPHEQTVSQFSRQQLLGRRDWSDVLGVASMTGWPATAVMRASRRCAELFGEDMFFQTMNEGKIQLIQDNERSTWKYTEEGEDETTPINTEKPKSAVPQFIGKLKEYAIYCPVKECSRHRKGFSRTWNLNQHMKNRHPNELRAGVTKLEANNEGEQVSA